MVIFGEHKRLLEELFIKGHTFVSCLKVDMLLRLQVLETTLSTPERHRNVLVSLISLDFLIRSSTHTHQVGANVLSLVE
jgi:hypothetical protein